MTVVGRASRVVSGDGTEVAYWTSGVGPPLVLVHGATADHARWRSLLPHLEPHATVHAVDRRGRGESGDAPDYHVEREFEDIAAVVDAVANASGMAVDVFGHSFGGLCALGAASRTGNVRRLVLYEPAASAAANALPPDVERRMDELLAAGQRDAALETFFREVVLMPEEELAAFRRLPAWRARVRAAHTLAREVRAVVDGGFDAARAAQVTAPTLMLLGGDSPPVVVDETTMVATALTDVRVSILEGQQHIAVDLDPETVAGRVRSFLRGDR